MLSCVTNLLGGVVLEPHLSIPEFSKCKHCFSSGADGGGIQNVVTLLEVSPWSFLMSMLDHTGQWLCLKDGASTYAVFNQQSWSKVMFLNLYQMAIRNLLFRGCGRVVIALIILQIRPWIG
jgi:hypothetical protein